MDPLFLCKLVIPHLANTTYEYFSCTWLKFVTQLLLYCVSEKSSLFCVGHNFCECGTTRGNMYKLQKFTCHYNYYYYYYMFWIFWCKMKITQADVPTIRIDCHLTATRSRLIGAPTSAIPTIFMPDTLPSTTLPIYPGLGQAPNMLACIHSGLVYMPL